MINIAFFEDHPIVIDNLNRVFSDVSKFKIAFSATSKKMLYSELTKANQLDILIVDVLIGDVNGLEVFELLKEKYSSVRLIAFTSITSAMLVENLLSMNVKGYVNKNQEQTDLVDAVHTVYNNQIYLPTDYDFLLYKSATSKQKLTKKEIEVVQYTMKEYTISDIAEILSISKGTVETHRKSIFKKLNVKNVAGMVREAINLGLDN